MIDKYLDGPGLSTVWNKIKANFIDTAGTGLSKSGSTINHSNSVTAKTTQALYPIKIDSQGHISSSGTAVTSLPASDVYSWAKASTKPSYTASEVGAISSTGTDITGVFPWASSTTKISIEGTNTTDNIQYLLGATATAPFLFNDDTDTTIWTGYTTLNKPSASDVGAVPTSRTVNGKALSSNITLSASDVSAVPTSRTVNGKALSSNITLSASDVGAVSSSNSSISNAFIDGYSNSDSIKIGVNAVNNHDNVQYLFGARLIAPVLYNDTTDETIWTGYTTLNKPTASDVGAVPTSRTVNGKALSSNITLSASDVGAVATGDTISGFYKVTSTTIPVGPVSANSAKSVANYDITDYTTNINAGYRPVAIAGEATDNSAIKATARIYNDSGTYKIRSVFRNNSSSDVNTTYYFYILWLKATSG